MLGSQTHQPLLQNKVQEVLPREINTLADFSRDLLDLLTYLLRNCAPRLTLNLEMVRFLD
ncbi:predicted protein [Botrytis cinerea T4]|uniref:Uncharacterized protein n=1 Tax=Botryotinia fuckeliana (strain T4) TaxID=999810 RepID=G2XW14_BOTF4|nr:predicted protein [Botrytis cinerea T4]